MASDVETLEWKRNALVLIEKLKTRLQALESARNGAIAIVGLACRFPGSSNAEAFWKLLDEGREAIVEVPRDRWNIDEYFDPDPEGPGRMYTRYGGFLEQVDRFDAALFGIAPREAASMDPQQRVLLETAWEALESAGHAPLSLKGSRSGVYVGVGSNEYAEILRQSAEGIDAYYGAGNAANAIAGRVAFTLGLEGPAMAIDTACSSSLVALHQACQGLRAGECDLALAGGVNLMLRPATTIATCRARMLAPDGRCKTFDEAADGYVRGEGCGVVVLKRLADAQRDGDRILALVRGSAVNQDGASSGLTVPNGPAQERVIREALAQAGLSGRDVQYLEAHGTGTKLGDPIEIEAAAAVLGEGRRTTEPLLVGSVKTNIGHLEAASGIAGLIKIVLAMSHGRIPRHLHLKRPNSHIRWSELPVQVTNDGAEWRGAAPVAAVSSFGFTGTNAHVVLEAAAPAEADRPAAPDRREHVLLLSAKSEPALRGLARQYADWIDRHPSVDIGDVCHTAATGRSHLDYRAALVVGSLAEASQRLAAVAAGETGPNVHCGRRKQDPACAWLFGGEPWPPDTVRALYAAEPVFRSVVDRVALSEPPLYVLQFALAELWRSWGIEADTVLGEDLGEYAAAAGAGAIDFEEGLRLFTEQAPLPGDRFRATQRALLSGFDADVLGRRGTTVLFEMGPGAAHAGPFLGISALRDGVATAMAQLYASGVTPDFAAWDRPRPRRKLALPTYPFQRERYWPVPASTSADYPLASVRHVSAASGETLFHSEVGTAAHPYLRDHVIQGKYVMPATGFAAMVMVATGVPCRLSEVVISEPLMLDAGEKRRMQLAVQPAEDEPAAFEIHTQPESGDTPKWLLHCRGRVESLEKEYRPPTADELPTAICRRLSERDCQEFYQRSAAAGLVLGHAFRGIQKLWVGAEEVLAEIHTPEGLVSDARLPIHPAVLDACSQVAGVLIPETGDGTLFLPLQYRRLDLYRPAPRVFYCYGRLESSGSEETRHVGLRLIDPEGQMIGEFRGFVLKRARRESLGGARASDATRLLYGIRWEKRPAPPAIVPQPGTWLVAGEADFCSRLGAGLTALGHRCVADPADAAELQGVIVGQVEDPSTAGCELALRVVQDLIARSITPERGVWFVTRGTWLVAGAAAVYPAGGTLWGFARAIAAERPVLGCRLLDLDPTGEIPFGRLAEAVTLEDAIREQAWRGTARYVPRLARLPEVPSADASPVGADATYLVTGGLGALGRKVALWLAAHGAGHIVVTGRSASPEAAADLLAELARHNCAGHAIPADVSRAEDMDRVWAALSDLPPLRGVVHAAGVLDDGIVTEQTWERFERVLRPKLAGAWNLHRATRELPLDFFVLFSSLSAAIGSAAQSNYAAANGFLDALADFRRGSGQCAVSIHWGPWAEGGMASDRRLLARFRRQGLEPLSDQEALAAFAALLKSPRSEAAVLKPDWGRYAESLGAIEPAPLVEDLAPKHAVEGSPMLDSLLSLPAEKRARELESQVAALVQKVLSLSAPPDPGEGFFNLGMDSLSAVELSNLLQGKLGKAYELSSTAVFDYPNVSSLSRHLSERLLQESAVPAPRRRPQKRNTSRDPIAIVGVACRFPGGAGLDEFWEMLRTGTDAIREVPPDRWDVDAFYDPDPDVPGKMATRFGGFIRDVDRFDPAFFGISPREAESMDPQHRLLLEVSWHALEDAAIPPSALMGTPAGVFIGISTSDYTQLLSSRGIQSIDQYFGSGNSHSTAAGRLSYVLGLEGPCFTVDTACSASLVALHQACRALRAGDCSVALAGGVNAILIPENTVYFSKARMMAPDGRCKTFDASADGYVRGEGCGVVVLKPYRDAVRDGDRIWGLVRGSAVNQDGRSSGLTVPNGPAQERVIREALAEGDVEPEQVSYTEAHGTGTALGDPIELTALQGVFGPGRDPGRPLLVGSVKTNIGHLEAAAGMAGLIKVLLAMRHGRIPPHLHFGHPTPRIPWDRYALRVVTEPVEWPARSRIAGVSSFAFSGTNAHVVVEAPPEDGSAASSEIAERSEHVLVLSARTRSGISRLAADYRRWLERNPGQSFADVCFTAATGRAHFEERAAIVAPSAADAVVLLGKLETGAAHPDISHGRVSRERPRCGWRFSGLECCDLGMALELYETQPIFRAEVDRCREALGGDATPQTESFAVQVGFAALWKSLGITPDAVSGDGVGRYAVACVSGALPLEECLRLLGRGETNPLPPDEGLVECSIVLDLPSRRLALDVAKLYTAGLPIDFGQWDSAWQRRKLSLPGYPFERQRCWAEGLGLTSQAAGSPRSLTGTEHHLATGQRLFTNRLSPAAQPWLGEHRVFGEVVAPAAMYLGVALAAGGVPGAIRHASFTRAMQFAGNAAERELQLLVDAPDANARQRFEFFSRNGHDTAWTSHAAGYWERATGPAVGARESVEDLRARLSSHPVDELFEFSGTLGIELGPSFRGLSAVWLGDGEALGEIHVPRDLPDAGVPAHPAVLDCVLQLAGAAIRLRAGRAHVPFECERFALYVQLPPRFWCHARAREIQARAETATFDLQLIDQHGSLLGEVEGLVAKQASRASMIEAGSLDVESSLYTVEWREQPRGGFWLSPQALANEIAPAARSIGAGLEHEHRELSAELEDLSRRYIRRAFAELGFVPRPGEPVDADELAVRFGIAPRYRRLLHRLIEITAAAPLPGGSGDPAAGSAERLHRHPLGTVELTLLDRCGQALAAVLRGAADPLGLLFPRDGIGAEDLYRKAPRICLFNELVQKTAKAALAGLPPGRKLRVLEIGAGTGATTAALLPVVPEDRTEYVYTDISAAFFAGAETRFAEYPFLRFDVLDIEGDPAAQGFADGAFDLVIAANVLHATRDLEETLRHIRRLLAPSGLLAVIEGLERHAWLDLTFGLLDGWWRFHDAVRTDYALLSRERWSHLLASQGFEEVEAIALDSLPGQAMLVSRAPAAMAGGPWLIVGGRDGIARQLAERLTKRNQPCTVISPDENLRELLASGTPLAGAVYDATSGGSCAGALSLVQSLAGTRVPNGFGLWFVTRGAQVLGGESSVDIAQAPLWGMGKVVAIEHPELHCRRVDLDPDDAPGRQLDLLAAEIRAPEAEDEIVQRGERRLVARMTRGEPQAGRLLLPGVAHYQLQPGENATLEAVQVVPCLLPDPGPGEVQVKIEAAALNFRDVLEAMRALPIEIGPLGSELSGRVTAVGPGVSGFAPGDEVFGFGSGTFADVRNVPAHLVARKPQWLSHADAAAIPVAFATAELAFRLAALRPGERVLIHAASGGVGLAAVQMALAMGAEVYATASKPKQAYLRSLGVAHVYDSRSTAYSRAILADTGSGVQAVINSLTSEGFIEATLDALAPGGRFIELSKRSVWSAARMAQARPDVQYHILALDRILQESPDEAAAILRQLAARAEEWQLRPLPAAVLPFTEAREGFLMMRHARHIGKIVFANTPDGMVRFHPERALLITGGLGGLGLELARWMVERGARRLVLNGRRPPSEDAERKIEALRSRGVRIDVVVADISVESEVRLILDAVGTPLEGVFHLAGTLRDGALVNQTVRNFEEVLAPKADGAWHLHRLTAGMDLRWFVLFSSTASLLGNSGQANHAAANSFLDALASYRHSVGLPAISINWGAWSEIGSAIHGDVGSRLEDLGVDWISPQLGLTALERIMARGRARQAVLPIRWNIFRRRLGGAVPSLLEELIPAEPAAVAAGSTDILRTLEATPAANHHAVLAEFIASEVQQVLRLPDLPDAAIGFSDLGMDSLMAVELRNRLNRALPLEPALSSTALFDHPSVDDLAAALAGRLNGSINGTPPEPPAPDLTEGLSAEELSELLAGKMAAILGPEDLQ